MTIHSESNYTIEELQALLEETQQQLHRTELRLCEMEFQKVEYNRKYLWFERRANYWEDQARQIQSRFDVVLNSKSWKLRAKLTTPFYKHRSRTASPKDCTKTEEPQTQVPDPTILCNLPENINWDASFKDSPRIAVQVHAFYPDLIGDICEKLSNFPYKYDLYVTTTEKYKKTYLEDYLREHSTASKWIVEVVENRGRDVFPFLKQLQPVIADYDYFCHIHTKRSLLYDIGNQWRDYLYENLLGSTEQIQKILYSFEQNPTVGLIFPEIPEYVLPHIDWGSNKPFAETLMEHMHLESFFLPDNIIFPAGTMFWARTKAVTNIFQIDYTALDIPEEQGQTDGTIMHAVERLWVYIAEANGYSYQMTKNSFTDKS